MDYLFYDLQEPILLNAKPDDLFRIGEQFRSRAQAPLNHTMNEFHKAISGLERYKPPTATQFQGLLDGQNWLWVLGAGLKDLRVSFLYAAYHFERLEPTKYHRYTDPVFEAYSYFVEDTLVRAFSIGEKTAQLLNHLYQLGLEETKVSLNEVQKRIGQTVEGLGLTKLATAINVAKEQRHAYVHRFDPEIHRSSITPVECDHGELLVHGVKNNPLLASDAFLLCEETYTNVDEALGEVLAQINVVSLKF